MRRISCLILIGVGRGNERTQSIHQEKKVTLQEPAIVLGDVGGVCHKGRVGDEHV